MSDIVQEARRVADELSNEDFVWHHPAGARILRQLADIVERLPRTADGVPVVPGVSVFTRDGHPAGLWMSLDTTEVHSNIGDPTDLWDGHKISDCYSTREAALAAERNRE